MLCCFVWVTSFLAAAVKLFELSSIKTSFSGDCPHLRCVQLYQVLSLWHHEACSCTTLCLAVPGLDKCPLAPKLHLCSKAHFQVWLMVSLFNSIVKWTIIWIWKWQNKDNVSVLCILTWKRRAEVLIHFFKSIFIYEHGKVSNRTIKPETNQRLWYKRTKPFYVVVMSCFPLQPKLLKHWEYGIWKSNIVTHD